MITTIMNGQNNQQQTHMHRPRKKPNNHRDHNQAVDTQKTQQTTQSTSQDNT
jgi:hypothetical protein